MKLRLANLLRRVVNRLDPFESVVDRVFAETMPRLPDPMKPEKRDGPRPTERRSA